MQLRGKKTAVIVIMAVLLVAGGLVWAGASLAASSSPAPVPSSSGVVTLRIGTTNDPDNLNPFIGAETSSYEAWLLNYDFLVGYGLDLQPTPDLATSWEVSPDKKTWTFHLRQGVKWQDGQPFTAKDVAFTYNYIIKGQIGSYASLTTNIVKAVAVDDLTVKIICSKPKANLLQAWIPIVPEHVWSKVDPNKAGSSYVVKPPLIGTGPFQVTDVKKGNYVKMVANPTFWGKQPTVREIMFITYQNPDTMASDFEAGTIDAAWGIPEAVFPKTNTDISQGISYNMMTWDYLCMNCYTGKSKGNPALTDVKFRQALNWAIDRQRICDIGWSGHAQPGSSIMPPNNWVNPDYHWQPPADQLMGYDPEKAKQLLDAAGYKDTNGDGIREGKDGKPIKLRLWARSESPNSQKTGSLLAGWFRAIGIKIVYSVMDDGIYYNSIWAYQGNTFCPDFDMYLWTYDGYSNPGDTLASFTTPQIENWNEPAWSNPEFDATVAAANSELDKEKHKALIWKAQQIFYNDSPEIATDYPESLQAINTSRWDGWTRMYGGKGAAFYTSFNRDSYLNLKPKKAAKASGANVTVLAVAGAVIVIIIIVAVVVTSRKRRNRAVNEE